MWSLSRGFDDRALHADGLVVGHVPERPPAVAKPPRIVPSVSPPARRLAPLDDKGETTGRISAINELLSARIKKRTAILPLKRQILGETYGLSGDAMQQTVETATWQLKMELNELDAMRLDEEGAIQSLDT